MTDDPVKVTEANSPRGMTMDGERAKVRKSQINDYQADILAEVLSQPFHEGQRVPWSVMFIPPTWSGPLVGLIKRGFLKERRHNMFEMTPEGEAALAAWQEGMKR